MICTHILKLILDENRATAIWNTGNAPANQYEATSQPSALRLITLC